jgi:ABC-2 type transport system permease protein
VSATLSVPVQVWREHRALLGRWLARLRREPFAMFGTIVQPVIWLLLFGHLLSRMAAQASIPGGDYLRFMTAGAVVMTIFNASIVGGVELLFDRESGLLVRLFAAPVHRISFVTSRFCYVVGLSCVQSVVILLAAYALGVRYASGLPGVAGTLVIGALFGAGITSLSMTLAFALKNHADFFTITGFAGLPLTFVSSALVPLSLMPDWLRTLARFNPMTYAIDAVRSLGLDGWSWLLLGRATAALLLFDIACLVLATFVLRRGLAR